jgi:hypothetical protein
MADGGGGRDDFKPSPVPGFCAPDMDVCFGRRPEGLGRALVDDRVCCAAGATDAADGGGCTRRSVLATLGAPPRTLTVVAVVDCEAVRILALAVGGASALVRVAVL